MRVFRSFFSPGTILVLLIVFFLSGYSLFCSTSLASTQKGLPSNVLILHSYHNGLEWTDDIARGIAKRFAKVEGSLRTHTEYLDTKRFPDPAYRERILKETLGFKLRRISFDLVLVSDNDALNFVLENREDYFQSTPIVFCGVNDFSAEMLATVKNITGVAEKPSYHETIEMALMLQPELRQVAIIGNTRNDTTGQATIPEIRSIERHFQDRLRFRYLTDLPADELQQRLSKLPPDTACLLVTVLRNEQGEVLSFADSAGFIRKATDFPLYGLWEFCLGSGIIGGHLVKGVDQGQFAADLAIRILGGASADNLPVILNASNRYMADYNQLKRFNIPLKRLPYETTLINNPSRFYRVSKTGAWTTLAFLLFFTLSSLALTWNIRRRQEAEKALRAGEERLRLALEGSGDGMWDWHVPTGRNLVDHQWCAMLGFTKDEIEEHLNQWVALVHPDDLSSITAAQQECMAGEISHFGGEFRMRTKTGEWKWILGRGKVVARDRQGRPLRLAGTHKDISERKKTELELKEALAAMEAAKNKIDAILRAISDGLIVTDQNLKVVLMNPAAEKLLNIPAGKALNQSFHDLIGRISSQQINMAPTGRKFPDSFSLHSDSSETHEIQISTGRIQNRQGEDTGVVALLQDITHLREMDRMKSEFISTAAHELRTPLTLIMGYAELLANSSDLDQASRQDYLSVIIERAEMLENIVDELLDLSRIESGNLLPLEKTAYDLCEFMGNLVQQYKKLTPNHHFTLECPEQPVIFEFDRGKMSRALENLLGNAVKYSPGGGNIMLSLHMGSEGQIEIGIEDNGVGMSPEQVKRIFDKFYRGHAWNSTIRGLGLGTTIAHSIIAAHGGNIQVESEQGRGTRVKIKLPGGNKSTMIDKRSTSEESQKTSPHTKRQRPLYDWLRHS